MSGRMGEIEVRRYGAHQHMAMHSHDRSDLCVVLRGGYEDRLRGHAADCDVGALVLYPAGELHGQTVGAQGATKLVLSPTDETVDLIPADVLAAGGLVARSAATVRLGQSLAGEWRLSDPFSALAIDGLICELVAELGRAARRESAVPRWLAMVRDRIEDQPEPTPSLAELAQLVGREPGVVASAFKAAFGKTIGAHMREARLRMATRLLLETSTPLAEIAAACGYCDQSHFARAFRAFHGRSPLRFRHDA